MNRTVKCPVCRNADGGTCRIFSTGDFDSEGFECDICGKYEVSGTAMMGKLDPERDDLKPIQRAAISHSLRTASHANGPLMITRDWLKTFLSGSGLPNPAIQAINIIRYVGDEVSRLGEIVHELPIGLAAIVGAPNREFANRLVRELWERKFLSADEVHSSTTTELMGVNLTLDGWQQYEAESRGQVSGKVGFIAMKFGDSVLEPFVKEIVKPAVKDGIGYDLVDMRNVARAGIIDNIMRTQIRDAAFVIVDLTHDNAGAYWEAGYAEGLGKPVIYICESKKFDDAKTHFDTNHCTTVLWSQEKPDDFGKELIATLRRSLNLFPEAE